MHPDSANAYETLGEAQEKAGEKAEAVESYKKALEKDPENTEAKEKLKALEAVPMAK
jgi:predicted TPR repeat methyltransferase